MSFGASSAGERAFGEPSGGTGVTIIGGYILDALYLNELTSAQSTYLALASESLLFQEGTCHCDFLTLIDDAFSFLDVSTWDLATLLREIIKLEEVLNQDSTYNVLFDDDVVFADAVREAFAELLSDALVLTDTATYVREWDNRLRDLINLGDSAEATNTYNKLIADALALTDLASHAEQETLTDTMSLLDAVTGLSEVYRTLVDSILAVDTSSYIAAFSGSLSEAFVLGDTATTARIYEALLQESFFFALWDGNTQSAYTGYVMNTKIGGLTEYQNYNFNSIAKIGASYYGASNTGLYLLEGTDDAGTDIEVRLKFGAFDPGSGKKSRVEQAYIGVRSDGKIIFKTFADDGKERWYETQALHGDLQTQRAKLGRGVKSRYWQFGLVNRDGEPLELEQFEFLPITLTRRV